jgi:hypothetical protein
MCQNDPGMCDEWDPNLGGNVVKIVTTDSLESVPVPTQGNTLLPFEIKAVRMPFPGDYEQAIRSVELKNKVLGKIGDTPDWIQTDETPACNACGLPMHFVAQIEQSTGGQFEINFGGGLAYLFACPQCQDQAKFLWQC